MKTTTIQYCFILPDGREEIFDLQLDLDKIELVGGISGDYPEWTKLDFHICPHCSLTGSNYCPVAVNLVNIVKRLDQLMSYDKVHAKVITETRVVTTETTAQQGLSSLMGFVIAASGCPYTVFFKPMVPFHLPFANEEETTYRSTSMYLLAQYFLKRDGREADIELDGLKDIYNNVQIINISLADRLRGASKVDSTINALVMLDIFAKSITFGIDDALNEIRYLFKPYLTEKIVNKKDVK